MENDNNEVKEDLEESTSVDFVCFSKCLNLPKNA